MNSKPVVIIIMALALVGAAGFALAWHPFADPRGNKNIEARSLPTRADVVMEHFDRRAVYATRPFGDEP